MKEFVSVIFDVLFVILVFYIVFIIGIRIYWKIKSGRMVGREVTGIAGFGGFRKGKGLIYFSSPSCRPCKMLDPVVAKLSKELKTVRIVKVDVSKDPDKAREFGILATPTMILTENGRIKEVLVGPVSEKVLREKLSRRQG